MLYKQDWPEVRQRMLAWWAGELLDRVAIQVIAPRDGNLAAHKSWDWLNTFRHLDQPEAALREWETYCEATFFGGEFIPNLWINLGPGIPAAYLGAAPRLAEDTIWFEVPGDRAWAEILKLRLEPDNPWWRTTLRLTELAAEAGQGKYFAGVTDLNSVFNILGHLRGTQCLLTDLLDCPDQVQEACRRINRLWLSCYDQLVRITQRHQEGSAGWMSIWFPGRGGDVQCDFAAMISPAMFEEFVLWHIQEECRHLDQSLFHLDGPEQIPHLDLLLEIPELGGIQWVPGAGNPGTGSPAWFPLYRKIQAKGKRLVLQGMDKRDVEGVLGAISSRGLLIETRYDSEEEAREMLAKAAKWTRD